MIPKIVLSSRKPEAKPFRKWVTSEVLPSIRKTGSYLVKEKVNSELPSRIVALETAQAISEIKSLLADTDPRLTQFLVDHAVSDIMPSQLSLQGDRFRGVVEIAEDLGYSVSFQNRSQLGKFVKSSCSDLAKQEERLVNGQMRKVNCYPETSQRVKNAIARFFS